MDIGSNVIFNNILREGKKMEKGDTAHYLEIELLLTQYLV